MRYCGNCGNKVSTKAKFCPACGNTCKQIKELEEVLSIKESEVVEIHECKKKKTIQTLLNTQIGEYWAITGSAIIFYLISFIPKIYYGEFSFYFALGALGVIIGSFVMSKLIEYIYSLITKNKNQVRLKSLQAFVFLILAMFFFVVSMSGY